MTQNIAIGGEILSPSAAKKLIGMVEHVAKEMAGEFHDMNRSEKFRINWPVADEFVIANWPTFLVAARAFLTKRLGHAGTSEAEKKRIYLAIMLERAWSEGRHQQGMEANEGVQLAPGTQQFEGDKIENRKIAENFGTGPNLRALFKRSVAQRALLH